MRIIAGEKRSRRLKTPEGMDTRPTSDRVKESLFSILLNRLPGARILDLYAGSGALSLEALSRGARSAVLADKSKKACQVIRENIQTLEYSDRARLLAMDDYTALTLLRKEGSQFDLVFLDPPYRMRTESVCTRILEGEMLAEGGMIVVEHAKETPPNDIASLVLISRRDYGATGISFYQREEERDR